MAITNDKSVIMQFVCLSEFDQNVIITIYTQMFYVVVIRDVKIVSK